MTITTNGFGKTGVTAAFKRCTSHHTHCAPCQHAFSQQSAFPQNTPSAHAAHAVHATHATPTLRTPPALAGSDLAEAAAARRSCLAIKTACCFSDAITARAQVRRARRHRRLWHQPRLRDAPSRSTAAARGSGRLAHSAR